jgi:hypothetical protein
MWTAELLVGHREKDARNTYQEHVGEKAPYLVFGQWSVLVHKVLERTQLA